MTTVRLKMALAVMATAVALAGCLPSTPPPTALDVAIVQPTGGMVTGEVSLAAAAVGGGIHDVAFYVDNQQVGQATPQAGGRWVSEWDSTTIPDGVHSLTAQAFDVANNWKLSPPVTITTQNPRPQLGTVAVTSPNAGATLSASVVVAGTSSVPVTEVGLLMDEVPLGRATISGSSWTYTWDTTRAPEGDRLLSAWATDASGNSLVSAPVSVTVNNGVTPTPRDAQVDSAVEVGRVGKPPTVFGRDSGVTQQSGNGVTWLFGDTIFSPSDITGDSFVTATAATASLSDPLATEEPVDANGAPLSAIGFTPEEYAYNVVHEGVARFALWIIGSAPQADGSVLALYMKMNLPGSDPLSWVGEGAGVAHMLPGKTFAWRDPGLVFNKPEPLYADGVVDGPYFNVYQCDNWANPTVGGQCTMGRVLLNQIGTRSAYQFFAGMSAQQQPIWHSDVTKAVPIFPTAASNSGLTITWNSYLGQWVAVYAPVPSSGKIVARTAPAPYGPWSAETTLFIGRSPSHASSAARVVIQDHNIFGVYAGREHRELQREGGRSIDVTYFVPQAGFDGDLWMQRVTFSAPPQGTG